MAFDIRVNASKVNLKLEEMPEEVREAVLQAVLALGGPLADLARSRAEQLLQVRTGKFLGHIKFGLRRHSKNNITGRVYSSAKTANLFEWGGTTPAHDIVPKNARALVLNMRGGKVFAGRVHHPGGKYKALQIIHGAFDEMKPAIQASLESAVKEAVARE
jgi:hypothetical protein